jgi:hypothetical protein
MAFINYKNKVILFGLFLNLIFTVSACTVLGAGSPESTPLPTPTSSVPDMQVISPQACRVAEQRMIRVDEPQGDRIAWSPDADTVAYIASTQESSWNVGELNILTAPQFDTPDRLATGVAGELTWSPDASAIAYLGLRRSDTIYTIGLAYPDGRASKDLFPDEAAKTDDYSSQKSILKWMDSSHLRVLTSCGVDCMQTMDFNVLTGLSSLVGDPIQRNWDTWAVHTLHPSVLPTEVADLPGQLNWSPDEKRIAYIDKIGNAWVINVDGGSIYPLGIGQYGTATETDWSYDNQYLAVQVDQSIMIFSFNCP